MLRRHGGSLESLHSETNTVKVDNLTLLLCMSITAIFRLASRGRPTTSARWLGGAVAVAQDLTTIASNARKTKQTAKEEMEEK